MSWLLKLVSVNAPDHATLRSAELTLGGGWLRWAALVLFPVVAAVVFLLYRGERRSGEPRRWLWMALLRTAALGVLFLLVLQPILIAELSGERPRGIALLLDNSQSMQQRDRRLSPPDRLRVAIAEGLVPPQTAITEATTARVPPGASIDPDRAHLVRAALSNQSLGLLDGLRRRAAVQMLLFGQSARSADPEAAEPLAAFQANEPRTALADAIDELLHKPDDLPGAIVVMTDGQDNASRLSLPEVARECARLEVPLHIYGVGSSTGILQFEDVAIPDTLFDEDTVSVPVRWRAPGLTQGTVEIILRMGDQEVARREVTVRPGTNLREVLTFVPHRPGGMGEAVVDLVASIRLKGNEELKDDWKRTVRLLDRRVKVLYVESLPRWQYKFLQSALLRDRRVEVSLLLTEGDPRALQAGPPFVPAFPVREKLFAFDLLILGDVPASFLGTEHLEMIRDFVREGGGLVLLAGRQHLPAEYGETPLAEVLPVECPPAKFPTSEGTTQPFLPGLTELGKRSDMLALADDPEENAKTWQELPGLYWQYPIAKLRPGAVTLLENPRLKLREQSMPLLVMQTYGKGPVLFLASDETWRWRYNVGDRHFGRFWGQVIYQTGLPHLLGGAKRAQLVLGQSGATLGQPTSVHARLFDVDYRPLITERIAARLEHLDAGPGQERSRPLVFEPVAGQPGEYRALLANDVAGRFELKLTSPDEATLPFQVSMPAGHEMEIAGMAEDALREAARLSGGHFYREEDLARMPEQIEPRQSAFTVRQEVLLWNPLAMLLFVGLVTAEWVLRKFSNLS